jgi:hypothetical protein
VETFGFLTPIVDGPEVSVEHWIVLQTELLRDAFQRGDPAAVEVLRFADVVANAPRNRLDQRRMSPSARIIGTRTGRTRSPTGATE